MATLTRPFAGQRQGVGSLLVKTWLLVAVSDALFAAATGMLIPPAVTPARVFRGVASVMLGRSALDGGSTTALIGLAMHFGVALIWSAIFVFAVHNSWWLRDALKTWPSRILVAVVYGMSIWLIMTWIVIPSMVHKLPATFPLKYWVQLVGHPLFVVGPMIFINRRSA
ncbi:MAG TPA: hypothetical protein VM053_02645 [Gemmatimonadaceae bacterium]|nr:hypothetical protein [Gemmatimonadaceae bacterium]